MRRLSLVLVLATATATNANPPVASYLFPAGGQRGTTVSLKVGGLFLGKECTFALDGPGVVASPRVKAVPTVWFEGPMLPLPESQRQEDYPRDLAGSVKVAADAPLGPRRGHVATAEGVAAGLTFVVGDLPEVVEAETDGEPIPVSVKYPVTINGRVFPRQDVDRWTVTLKKGATITAAVEAAAFGSPLDARLEVFGPDGRMLADNDDAAGRDPRVRFTAPADGVYAVQVSDSQLAGSQAHVYRLTVTDGPWVDAAFPLGGRRGAAVKLDAAGHGLPATVEVTLPDADGPALVPLGPGGNPVSLDLDTLPEAMPTDKALSPPVVLNGRIDRPGRVEAWKLDLARGKAVAFEMRAARLGSRLQGVLVLKDATGKVVAQAEAKAGQPEPSLTFAPPADGTYTLEVSDRFAARGGPAFGYRVRVVAPQADFRLKPAVEVVNLERGKSAKVRVQVDRSGGFAEAVALTVEGLPAGVTAAPATVAKGAPNAEITLTATADAAVGAASLRVVGTSGEMTRSVPLLLGVAVPVPFKVVADYEMRWSARGSTHTRAYRIERNGFDGPLEVRLADRQARHLQGVTGPVLTIPPGQDRFEYPVQLAPDMEIGRTCRVCVMATGIVKAGDRPHEVSYSKTEQNDQIVTVVETGRLGIEAGVTAVEARPGATVDVPVKVVRARDLAGPVTVELRLAGHLRGVAAEPVVIPAEAATGTVRLRFAREIGPFNTPVTLRATHSGRDGTTLAEARLEILTEPK